MLKLLDLKLILEKGGSYPKMDTGDHLFIPSGAVFSDGIRIEKCSRISEEVFRNIPSHKVLKDGDILFNTGGVGTLGRVAYYDKKTIGEGHVCDSFVLVIRNQDPRLISKYLFYLMQSNYIKQLIEKYTVGSTGITAIRSASILEFRIPLPNRSIQEDIVRLLDNNSYIRHKRKKTIQLLSDFLRSTFLEMFGDPIHNPKKITKEKIGLIGEVITGNTPSRQKKEYYGDFIEWIKSDNINTPQFTLTKAEEYLSKAGADVGRIAPKGAVLVTCIAGSPDCIGNIAMADRDVAFNQQINAFVPGKRISQKFFFVQILFCKKLIQQVSTNGMKGIVSKGKFSDIRVLVPEKEMQEESERIFDQVNNMRSQMQQSAVKLDSQFNSLLQEHFGEAQILAEDKFGTRSTPSVNEIERLISFQDLWIRHPQRPQGHKRHLAQAIVMFLENRNK